MAVQFSVSARNAMLDAFETQVQSSAILEVRSGSQPANCAAADSGTLIAQLQLPADYLSAAATGTKDKLGTWTGVSSAIAVMGHFRMKNSAASTTHAQGAITSAGGAGDLKFDTIDAVSSQTITISSWLFTAGNA